jgi:arginine deiminase
MAGNVLAVRPGVVVMVAGNPRTRAALESAGCEVHVYDGSEISVKGVGGPTCLTAPILRD